MIIRGGLGDSAQSLRQSCSHETPAGRFGSCGTRLVGIAPSETPALEFSSATRDTLDLGEVRLTPQAVSQCPF